MENERIAGAAIDTQQDFYKKISLLQGELENLRADGVDKINYLKNENLKVKRNRNLSNSQKSTLIKQNTLLISKARKVAVANKEKEIALQTKAVQLTKAFYKKVTPVAKKAWSEEIVAIKKKHAEKVKEIEAQNKAKLSEIQKRMPKNNNNAAEVLAYKNDLKTERSWYKQVTFEEKTSYQNSLQKVKNEKHSHFLQEFHLLNSLRNGRNSFEEIVESKIENYGYEFNLANFLIKNGLYILLFVFAVIAAAIYPDNLAINNIMLILQTFSYKVFFALGVAGLILLAGTDLSIGRMVTIGSLITCIILNPNTTTTFFGITFDGLHHAPVGVAVICALLLSIILCTLFSMVAGFFSAKFKIHPFISTLGTQMIIWGIAYVATNGSRTGSISTQASSLAQMIGVGNGFSGFPLIFFYALITILVCSFIWNKTKFGKYLYAVGGNPDAASVSGISVFWVTMGAFIMAGVLYGLGGTVVGLQMGAAAPDTGAGWELEAIAACVVGGISFMGGIGKISGAVIGCAIFEVLKNFLGNLLPRINAPQPTYVSYMFIGIIILLAVTFDSLKYLKKK